MTIIDKTWPQQNPSQKKGWVKDVHSGKLTTRWLEHPPAFVVGMKIRKTRWWFQTFFICTPILGEMIQFDYYFSDELKPPTRKDGDFPAFVQLIHLSKASTRATSNRICPIEGSRGGNGAMGEGYSSQPRNESGKSSQNHLSTFKFWVYFLNFCLPKYCKIHWLQPNLTLKKQGTLVNRPSCFRKTIWNQLLGRVSLIKKNSRVQLGDSKNRGTPKWMVYIMENSIKIDDLGVPLFLETPSYSLN